MRRFELSDGKSNKFWEISSEGKSITVRFGRMGTSGQTQTKSFTTDDAAARELAKLVAEKTKKGYIEAGAPASAESPPSISLDPGPGAAKPKGKAAPRAPDTRPDPGWVDVGGGYFLSLRENKLVCRKGAQTLASVPKAIKDGEIAEQLQTVRDWLVAHARECAETVEAWMLRSLSTPRAALEAVWADSAWRRALENLVVIPAGDAASAGFFRGVGERGVGVVTLDGETAWIDAATVAIPHPILIADLDDFRSLATELSLTQGTLQLFRETWTRPKELDASTLRITSFQNGKFQQLTHALGHCKKLGYRVTGGNAIMRVWEDGQVYEARYWVGADDPFSEAWTGDLAWVDEKERALKVADVPPVAFSEGMRMASAIYAGRVVEKETGVA